MRGVRGGRRYRGQTFAPPAPVMLCAHARDCKAIKTVLSHASAVDRRALPGIYTPNDAICCQLSVFELRFEPPLESIYC